MTNIFFLNFKDDSFLLFAISERFELQGPDCTYFEDFLKQNNLFVFFSKFMAFLEAVTCFVEGVAKLFSQIVEKENGLDSGGNSGAGEEAL